ncbi:hypothetical protein WJ542_15400 [Paraburkholderia sp. B3]|uniref:hypothetical protein n=2 Tax=Paraburkholderia TaxID=1822464 RepID=UPI003981A9ED
MAASFGCSHTSILGQQQAGKKVGKIGRDIAPDFRARSEINLKGFGRMLRIFVAAAMAAFLSACADDMTVKHHGTPPQDPPDYHGVPTDDRPPTMIDNPPPAQ